MKLAEIKGERAVIVIADLIAPITNIATDEGTKNVFRMQKKEGEDIRETAIRDFKQKIPALIKTHKTDVLDILCAVNDSDPDDLSLVDIFKGAIDLANDRDFMSLFLSAVNQTETTQPTEFSADATNSEPELSSGSYSQSTKKSKKTKRGASM